MQQRARSIGPFAAAVLAFGLWVTTPSAPVAAVTPPSPPTACADTGGVTGPKCPNLQARPAEDLQSAKIGNRTRLRFTTATQNVGKGPLELRGGEIVNGKSKQRVYQRIYTQDTPDQNPSHYTEFQVGDFVYHPQHRHFHLENYALYELIPASSANQSIQKRTSAKTSFCVQDTLKITWTVPLFGIDDTRHYIDCNGSLQGMTRGWADRYGYQLAGQEIDTTGLPNGPYTLQITVNPNYNLYETDFTDNVSTVSISLVNGMLQP